MLGCFGIELKRHLAMITMRLHLLLLTTAATVIGGAAQVSPGCNYYQDVAAGQTFQVFSPNYPNNYPAGTNCRWEAVAPSNSQLTLTCSVFNLPSVSDYNAVICRCLFRTASGLFCTHFL
jgi:hypothetical protein